MKLRLELAPFAAAVADAARALPARPPVPVLAALRLDATAGQLTVAAFDYEVSARATLAAGITKAGSVLVPGRLLSDITRTVKGTNSVDLELVGPRLVLTFGSIRYTLHTLPLEEYPSLPKFGEASGTVTGSELGQAVAQVAVAAGHDDTVPILTGIHLTTADGKLTLAATDRYRFAVRTIDFTSTSDTADGQAVVPAKALLDSAKMLAGAGQIDLALPTSQSVFGMAGPSRSTTMRALEGQLPNYKSLWPTDFTATAVVDRDELTAAVKRVALVADRSTPVQLHFAQDALTLTAGSGDDAQARDRVDAAFDTETGGPLTVAFNPTFLLDGLGAIDVDAVKFSIVAPTKPAVITGVGKGGKDLGEGALEYLLMPVRLPN
ncbi:DNA polymerase III subunit beta [Streptomyces sp. NBC_00154]|uniref:DNA polymerase III subunit beta n=1 Tax=Streptomyces sp. NBC_00154 TaxID=2975670 RepID=UPI002257B05A|nr:DNA polymerase III subunit beta [Streptomyces sp. NBC_00154]MCX5318112.1 DNA polymerase III subunit beta [Streptomyces sp. NBC_00154]